MKSGRRDRMILGGLIASMAGIGLAGHGAAISTAGYSAVVPNITPKAAVPGASHRRRRIRKGYDWFGNRRSKHKPHQGAREKARRVERHQTDNPIKHAQRWASWKTGRKVEVIDGIAFCSPAPVRAS